MNKFRLKSGITVGVLFSFMTLALLFQNCSQQNLSSSAEAPSYSSGPQKINLTPGQSAETSLCWHGDIKCYKKVYSPDVQDSTSSSSECILINDKEMCFPLEITNYDTRRAIADCKDCDPSAGRPKGRYYRDEFSCWLNVKSQNGVKFFALKSDLKSALSETLKSCLDSLPAEGEQ